MAVALAMALLASGALASDLQTLAEIHAPAGNETAVVEYIRSRIQGSQQVDNTGSLTARFGHGSPHTLLIAGLDEPGYVVSSVTEEGYLRLERLADPAPHFDFDSFFVGQPVRITTYGGRALPAVVAAPSVHFGTGAGAKLFVDVGAASSEEVRAAGVRRLDTVTLEKSCVRLGEKGRVTAPWISSRSGVAILMQLARRMGTASPPGTVTLAFVTQQHRYNRGLERVLKRMDADRVVLLRPGRSERTMIAPAFGWSSTLADDLLQLARQGELPIDRGSVQSLSLGPFGEEDVWPNPQQSAAVAIGVENAGTPVEVVDTSALASVASLLAGLCGLALSPPFTSGDFLGKVPSITESSPGGVDGPASGELLSLIAQLAALPAVSGAETAVRDWIRDQLPAWAQQRSTVDEKGNLIVKLGGDAAPESVIIAHMDEIGFRVTRVESNGRLAVETLGGGSADLFAWRPVRVYGTKGPIPGIMTRYGSVDIGAESRAEAEAMGAGPETRLTVPKALRSLLGARVTGRSLDDRAGCAVLLSALRKLDPKKLSAQGAPVWLVFSVEEETGLRGARFLAERAGARYVYAVDSFVTSDSPVEEESKADARLGAGFVVRAIDNSGITPRQAVERVMNLAQSRGIPAQRGVTAGGNDGSVFVPWGAVNVPLSFPLRYAHSPAEVADLGDIEALRDIVMALVTAGSPPPLPH